MTDSGVRSSCDASAVNSTWRWRAGLDRRGDAPADGDRAEEDDEEQERRDQRARR